MRADYTLRCSRRTLLSRRSPGRDRPTCVLWRASTLTFQPTTAVHGTQRHGVRTRRATKTRAVFEAEWARLSWNEGQQRSGKDAGARSVATTNTLYEAMGTVERSAIRMAIGQLMDYKRPRRPMGSSRAHDRPRG